MSEVPLYLHRAVREARAKSCRRDSSRSLSIQGHQFVGAGLLSASKLTNLHHSVAWRLKNSPPQGKGAADGDDKRFPTRIDSLSSS